MICLTFDSDHLDDYRMGEWVESLDIPGRATLYCTQRYPCLDGGPFEIGPHPFLGEGVNVTEQVKIYRDLFPEALSWRSHSLVFSQVLSFQLADLGYTSVSTSERYFDATCRPDFSPWGLWQFPIYYMDNADFDRSRRFQTYSPPIFDSGTIDIMLSGEGIYVVDLHPIHIMLNTPHFEFYSRVRDGFKAHEPLSDLRYSGYGVGDFFGEILRQMRERNIRSQSISEVAAKLQVNNPYSRLKT